MCGTPGVAALPPWSPPDAGRQHLTISHTSCHTGEQVHPAVSPEESARAALLFVESLTSLHAATNQRVVQSAKAPQTSMQLAQSPTGHCSLIILCHWKFLGGCCCFPANVSVKTPPVESSSELQAPCTPMFSPACTPQAASITHGQSAATQDTCSLILSPPSLLAAAASIAAPRPRSDRSLQ